mmetsp:Transcript_104723/g.233775  ORF Transcript_104723/g.233775 Transcript_104723/m.233775 type:complete len:99 (-) Transcript_104723:1186-1482(-)
MQSAMDLQAQCWSARAPINLINKPKLTGVGGKTLRMVAATAVDVSKPGKFGVTFVDLVEPNQVEKATPSTATNLSPATCSRANHVASVSPKRSPARDV